MTVKIIGKSHRKGVSKKGNDYDFNVVYFVGPDRGVTGMKGLEAILDPVSYPLDSIHVGSDYELEWGPGGSLVSFKPVK